MPVSEVHPEYRCAEARYKLIRAIINNDAKCYIRTPDITDPIRSQQYKEDAILTNFTKLTCEGLTGLVFRKDLVLELPPELFYLEDDITGGGINARQFSQHIMYDTLQLGRYGLLVDYHNDGGKAYLKPYRAETIINWKAVEMNGTVQPWLIVLKEERMVEADDMFCQRTECQYRVLILDDEGYHQEIYNEAEEHIYSIYPTDFDGRALQSIPFVFIGSENNDWAVDGQPLYDLAVLNLGHYRNSADYEESIFINGQPYTVVNVGEASQEEFMNANPGGVAFGSRKALVLASGGSAMLLQADPNQLVARAMTEKLEQAAKVGARLIEEAGGRETAEAAKIRYGSQHSALYTLTSNISWGVEKALGIVCKFMGANREAVEYELNSEFYEETPDANLIAQMWMGLDKATVSREEIRTTMISMGLPLDPELDLSSLATTDSTSVEKGGLSEPTNIPEE